MRLPQQLHVKFIEETIPPDLLENMVGWIGDNLAPEDVFEGHVLEEWAMDNEFVRNEQ